jgi:DNA-binding transcriptional MerR regulator
MEGQKLFMIDQQPRRFNANDYRNFPLDIKRYIIQTWKNTGFSKKEVEQIKQELRSTGVAIKL